MIIFIAGISMEFSSQFGYITTRGIAAQLFLKILKSVFSKMCVCYYLTGANHYFFGCKRFRQSNINEKFLSTFNSKRIHVRRLFAQYSYANFQIFTAAYNFDNKTLLYNNNCKSLMYCQHIPNSFFI